jgi:drug/metabolite transporter (DMT)-like permease
MLIHKITGILFAMLAMCLFNLSPLLQKSALNKIPQLSFWNWRTSFRHLITNRRWLVGFAVGCIGLVPYFIALDLAGVAVVQPLYGFGFIVLVYMSHRLLQERLHPGAWTGIGLLILMPVFIALGNVSNVQVSIADRSVQWNLLLFVLILGGISLLLSAKVLRHPTLWAFISGIFYGLAAVFMQSATSFFALLTNWGWDRNLAMLIAALLLAVPANIFADYCLQIGLQRKNASRFAPISQTVNNAVAVAGGLFIFRQQVGHWGFYLTALALGAAGLFLLTAFKHSGDRPRFKQEK